MPYLIDGHNLIGQMPGLRLDDPDDEWKLVELLRGWLARAKKRGVVVFDPGHLPAQPGGAAGWSTRSLQVVFAPAGQTADQVIQARLRQERNPRGLIVVSSDQAVARAAQQAGAQVKAAREYAAEVLRPRGGPPQKETGLRPDEVAEWEAAFRRPPGPGTPSTSRQGQAGGRPDSSDT